jgi:spore germination protein KA
MYVPRHLNHENIAQVELKDILLNEVLFQGKAKLMSDIPSIMQGLMEGNSIILIEGLNEAFLIGSRNVDKRSIENPDTERIIRGPREGFIELLQPNLALLRYRLQTTDFRIKTMRVGRITKTKIAIWDSFFVFSYSY